MPGYRPGAGNGVPPAPVASTDPDLPPAAKSDLDQARGVKDQAATDFKAKNYGAAADKYFKILNIIRHNDELKASASGQELETQARLNIALCKINDKEYDVAIDQCERVLDRHPGNHKACFRLATAMYETSDKCTKAGSEGSIRGVHNYAKKACVGLPNDKKLREFYDEVKVKFDAYQAAQDAAKAKAAEEEKQAAAEKEQDTAPVAEEKSEPAKKGLRRVVVTDPEEERAKAKKEQQPEKA
jgi:tetratricopeptide (TPR) repeat protein